MSRGVHKLPLPSASSGWQVSSNAKLEEGRAVPSMDDWVECDLPPQNAKLPLFALMRRGKGKPED